MYDRMMQAYVIKNDIDLLLVYLYHNNIDYITIISIKK